MKAYLFCALACLTFIQSGFAQGKLVDRRDQAEGWYVPIHGKVMADGKKASNMEVVLYRDNLEVGRMKGKKNGLFELELDIDQMYSVRVIKDGYQEKLIYVDTKIPKDLVVYPDYICFLNLLKPDAQGIDPFYTDFPSAIVRYDPDQGGFYHSDDYLAHIQTKLVGYAKVTK